MNAENDPLEITDKVRVLELLQQWRRGQERTIDLAEMQRWIKRKVHGQDQVVDPLCRFIRLQWGKKSREKPIANLLLVGPPGTGKTQLAKALAEYLFDDEKQMLRFDCSSFSGPEAKNSLIGSPTGYVGADQGGKLTRPMLSNPRRMILFDEVEKSYSGVFDLFLSMMGEGRLEEAGSGNVADFTQSIIILTSNAQFEPIVRLLDNFDDSDRLDDAVRSELKNAKTFSPEFISRLDHVYVFKPLAEHTRVDVTTAKLQEAAEQFGVEISYIAPELVAGIVQRTGDNADVRPLQRFADDTLGEVLMQAREQGYKRVAIDIDENSQPILRMPIDHGEADEKTGAVDGS